MSAPAARNTDTTQTADTGRQAAVGKMLRHFTMSLDGFLDGKFRRCPIRVELLRGDDPPAAVNVRHRPVVSG